MKEVLVCGAVRSPIGDLNGIFAGISAVELGKTTANACLQRGGIMPDEINEVIIGNVLQAGQGQNPARQIAIQSGIPQEIPAFTVNQVCGSGLKAIDLARRSILLNDAEAVLAGGVESMSNAPYILPALRQGARLGECAVKDTVICDGLTDAFGQYHMGITAENVAGRYGISREAQDAFAVTSQRRYAAAKEKNIFRDEIVPFTVKQRKSEITIADDEHPRPDTTLEALKKLRPAFKPDGSVTAGNASGINDGAAAVIVVSGARRVDRAQCVRILDIVSAGCEPALMGIGPVNAVRILLARQHMTVNDIDLWELNEAFAAQSIAVMNELRVDHEKVNINGGAIALGHPIGASGARIVVSLIHQIKRQHAGLGIASLCVGGGMGLAILLENI